MNQTVMVVEQQAQASFEDISVPINAAETFTILRRENWKLPND
jgi:hypothetical protein